MIKNLKDGATMLKNILEQLQPGNILLEKTPYTLTDKSILSHFGRAAIRIGRADQLRKIKALALPIVQKILAKITEGCGVKKCLSQ
jgi:hypothetical protein